MRLEQILDAAASVVNEGAGENRILPSPDIPQISPNTPSTHATHQDDDSKASSGEECTKSTSFVEEDGFQKETDVPAGLNTPKQFHDTGRIAGEESLMEPIEMNLFGFDEDNLIVTSQQVMEMFEPSDDNDWSKSGRPQDINTPPRESLETEADSSGGEYVRGSEESIEIGEGQSDENSDSLREVVCVEDGASEQIYDETGINSNLLTCQGDVPAAYTEIEVLTSEDVPSDGSEYTSLCPVTSIDAVSEALNTLVGNVILDTPVGTTVDATVNAEGQFVVQVVGPGMNMSIPNEYILANGSCSSGNNSQIDSESQGDSCRVIQLEQLDYKLDSNDPGETPETSNSVVFQIEDQFCGQKTQMLNSGRATTTDENEAKSKKKLLKIGKKAKNKRPCEGDEESCNKKARSHSSVLSALRESILRSKARKIANSIAQESNSQTKNEGPSPTVLSSNKMRHSEESLRGTKNPYLTSTISYEGSLDDPMSHTSRNPQYDFNKYPDCPTSHQYYDSSHSMQETIPPHDGGKKYLPQPMGYSQGPWDYNSGPPSASRPTPMMILRPEELCNIPSPTGRPPVMIMRPEDLNNDGEPLQVQLVYLVYPLDGKRNDHSAFSDQYSQQRYPNNGPYSGSVPPEFHGPQQDPSGHRGGGNYPCENEVHRSGPYNASAVPSSHSLTSRNKTISWLDGASASPPVAPSQETPDGRVKHQRMPSSRNGRSTEDSYRVVPIRDWKHFHITHFFLEAMQDLGIHHQDVNFAALSSVTGQVLYGMSTPDFEAFAPSRGRALFDYFHNYQRGREASEISYGNPSSLHQPVELFEGCQSALLNHSGGNQHFQDVIPQGVYVPQGTQYNDPYRIISPTPQQYCRNPTDFQNCHYHPPTAAGKTFSPLHGLANGNGKGSENLVGDETLSDPDADYSSEDEKPPPEPPKKRGPGRPPKPENERKRKAKKTGRLWEFIRNLLLDPKTCPELIKWENVEDGVFRFVQSERVAEMWGMRKNNSNMNYEKLSRAIRYYYKRHIFEPVLGKRLVYQFGVNAKGWRPTNQNQTC